jgi:hypothetical protein
LPPNTNNTNITFNNNPTGTPNVTTTGGTGNRVASTTPTTNQQTTTQVADNANGNGADNIVTGSIIEPFPAISQYDPKQYTGGTLPDYADKAGLAAIFAMLARGVAKEDPPKLMIDGFWATPDGADWRGADGQNPVKDKVVFSDGAGKEAVPPAGAFPIEPGKTDFATLLADGPVLLGGKGTGDNAEPHWLLATKITDDGIVANDPATGRQVLLAYDKDTKTIGGVSKVFDKDAGVWQPIGDAGSDAKTAALGALALNQYLDISLK